MTDEHDNFADEGAVAAGRLNPDSRRGDRVSGQRQRTSYACDNCRRRKGRCRRGQAHALKCDHCEAFDSQCTYLDAGLGRGIRRKRRPPRPPDRPQSRRQDSRVQLADDSLPARTSQWPSPVPRHATSVRIVDERMPNKHLLSGSEEASASTILTPRVWHGAGIDHSPSAFVYTLENAPVSPASLAGGRQLGPERDQLLHLGNTTPSPGLSAPSISFQTEGRSEALQGIVEKSVHTDSASTILIDVLLTHLLLAIAHL